LFLIFVRKRLKEAQSEKRKEDEMNLCDFRFALFVSRNLTISALIFGDISMIAGL